MAQASSPKFNLSECLKDLEAKKHCQCEGREVHGHCFRSACNAIIAEGESECAACKERENRRGLCYECHKEYYRPPADGPMPGYFKLDRCSETCLRFYVTRSLKEAGLPRLYRGCSFENFDPYTPNLKKKLSILRAWATGELKTGLYLFGPVGTGKSHLQAAVMRELGRSEIFGRYVNGREFAMRSQSSFSHQESVLDIVDELVDGRYLAVDDLASEKPTEFVRQCLLGLIDRAYTSGTVPIVTSNLTINQLNSIDPRIASRLAQMCDLIEIQETDYRVRLALERRKSS